MPRDATQAIAAAAPRKRNIRVNGTNKINLARYARRTSSEQISSSGIDKTVSGVNGISIRGLGAQSRKTKCKQEQAARDDIQSLLSRFSLRQSASLQDFRDDWRALGFFRIHTVATNSETYELILRTFYVALLELLDSCTSPYQQAGICFALYALFFSRPSSKPILLIHISPRQMHLVLNIQSACVKCNMFEAVSAITNLLGADAFLIVPYNVKAGGLSFPYFEPNIPRKDLSVSAISPHALYIRELVNDTFFKKSNVLSNMDDWNTYDHFMSQYTNLKKLLPQSITATLVQNDDDSKDPLLLHSKLYLYENTPSIVTNTIDPRFADTVRQTVDTYESIKQQRINILSSLTSKNHTMPFVYSDTPTDKGIAVSTALNNGDLLSPAMSIPIEPIKAFASSDDATLQPSYVRHSSEIGNSLESSVPLGTQATQDYTRHNVLIENLMAGLEFAGSSEFDVETFGKRGTDSLKFVYHVPSDESDNEYMDDTYY
ncbi:Small nuclear RNA activating complex, polypeptide 1, 43kDa [Batrachochytrium dendrobatidis]|nr:Small nuclear RNA activating complex, polypeptide 1, 43kDa [Batrachochytrium dendrobatidis]